MKFAFYTLGCKVNLFETQALQQLAQERGHEIVNQNADAVIINTCTVTSVSDHKNIRAFHKMRKENPNAVIAACGCFAQLDSERIEKTKEIDIICGTRDRAAVIGQCERSVLGYSLQTDALVHDAFELLPAGVPAGRTRALLKIEDGCDNYCTYCIIPFARGHVRSMPLDKVGQEADRLVQKGVREIVLTGIEISAYGKDLTPAVSLADLLHHLLRTYSDVRFRLGSLDPRIIDEGFCERLCSFPNFARHFHLSLQSGCNTVLKRMGRRYTAEQYYSKVKLLNQFFPRCSITTDLIVGFPGETEDEFQQSLRFLQTCQFAAVHVFPFSPREGTRAAKMDGQLPGDVKAARAAQAKNTAADLSAQYLAQFIGETLNVLPEHEVSGRWASHGRYGFPIYIEGSGIQKNVPVDVRATARLRDGLAAEKI